MGDSGVVHINLLPCILTPDFNVETNSQTQANTVESSVASSIETQPLTDKPNDDCPLSEHQQEAEIPEKNGKQS